MPLTTKTKDQFLSDIITAWCSIVTAATGIPLSPNWQSGDPLLAIFQSQILAGLLFLQGQAVTINQLTRAQTSTGADLDSWMAQFGFARLAAYQATSGQVQLGVNVVSGTNINIPAGTVIQTADGTVKFQLVADTGQAAWNAGLNAYVLPAGHLTITATVQALVAGSSSNVQIGALNSFAAAPAGINTVTNLAAITNGRDLEGDASFRARFILFINTVNARTTLPGMYSACVDINGVENIAIIENQDVEGNFLPGTGVVVIDDGSGSPPSSLLNSVRNAVAVPNAPSRGFLTNVIVIPPVVDNVSIGIAVRIDPSSPSLQASMLNVTTAIINYVNALNIGATLYLENISAIAKGADPFVIAVGDGSVLINGKAASLVPSNKTIIRTNNILTVVGTF